ncbi:MAG: CYTH domain-containing protein [Clostridia bacterium]|nr:CYTH domain-containing protein [Clostridia bacterium]
MEIERKFLVKSIPDNLESYRKKEIEQCYISTDPTIRLRKSNDSYILTVKGKGSIAREEFELELTQSQYERLSYKAETPAVAKTRYLIPIDGGLTAELDIYYGRLSGLATVEVEFSTVSDAEAFIPPNWFGEDVSRDKRYKNTWLAVNGLPKD